MPKRSRRHVSVAATAVAALALTLVWPFAAGAQDDETQAQALATDDGFALAVHATGDFAGNFDPCGCKVPLGGLARRVGLARAVETVTHGKAPLVQLDAGRLFAAPVPAGQVEVNDVAARNEWVLRAGELVGLRAANVAAFDLPFLSKMMAAEGFEQRAARFPLLERFVSANVVPSGTGLRAFKPYTIVEVRGERLGPKPLRIGVVGVAEVPKAGASVAGYTIGDPAAALAKVVPELRPKCDLLVVLAYMKKPALLQLGESTRGIDVVIGANQLPKSGVSGELELPILLTVTDEGRDVTELRLYRDAAAAPASRPRFVRRDVVLSPSVPGDRDAARLVEEAKKAYVLSAAGS